MSEIQHREAHRLLSLLAKNRRASMPLTYVTAAKALGRKPTSARMVANACDLLDAAAATAGLPLLALSAVREKSGGINRNAWVGEVPPGLREQIIDRSAKHRFRSSDFTAIRRALNGLEGLGNLAAWKRFGETYGNNRYRVLLGMTGPAEPDAINDLGSDAPLKTQSSSWHYARDPKVRNAVLRRAKGKCEFCGEFGFLCADGSSRYLECHHIIALAADGKDKMSNVIALCPNDHRQAHFGQKQKEIEQEMIRKITSSKVPRRAGPGAEHARAFVGPA